jgi:hypothetical protein
MATASERVALVTGASGGLGTAAAGSPPLYPDYAPFRATLTTHFGKAIEQGASAETMAREIVDWAERPGRNLRRRFGADAKFTPLLKQFLPERLFVAGARRRFGLVGIRA